LRGYFLSEKNSVRLTFKFVISLTCALVLVWETCL